MGCLRLTYQEQKSHLKVVHSVFSSVEKEGVGMLRYGFQAQERDDEIKGPGNSYNYTYRMHDPRLGRFFAVDPVTSIYPELTPYQFSSNTPIWGMELEGLESSVDPRSGKVSNYPESPTYTNPNTSYPAGKPLGTELKDWVPLSATSLSVDPSRNPTNFTNTTADYNGDGFSGDAFVQYGQWNTSTTTQTTSNTANGGNNQVTMNQQPVATVGNAFLAGQNAPAPAFTAAVNNAQASLNTPLPAAQQNIGPLTQISNTSTGPVVTNSGMTITNTNTVINTQVTNTVVPTNNVVTVSFSTTQGNNGFTTNLLQNRFNGLMNAMGNPSNVIYNSSGNNYNLAPAAMGGNVNQAIINTAVQATGTSTTTTTTNTTTTTQQFDTMR